MEEKRGESIGNGFVSVELRRHARCEVGDIGVCKEWRMNNCSASPILAEA